MTAAVQSQILLKVARYNWKGVIFIAKSIDKRLCLSRRRESIDDLFRSGSDGSDAILLKNHCRVKNQLLPFAVFRGKVSRIDLRFVLDVRN